MSCKKRWIEEFLEEVVFQSTLRYLVRGIKDLVRRLELNKIGQSFNIERLNTLIQCKDSRLQKSFNKIELERLDSKAITKGNCYLIKVLTYFMGFKSRAEIRKFRYVKMKQDYTCLKSGTVSCKVLQNATLTIYAPIYKLKNQLKSWDMLSVSGKPKFCGVALKYNEVSIIEFFNQTALGILNFYTPVLNLYAVKKLVNYHLR